MSQVYETQAKDQLCQLQNIVAPHNPQSEVCMDIAGFFFGFLVGSIAGLVVIGGLLYWKYLQVVKSIARLKVNAAATGMGMAKDAGKTVAAMAFRRWAKKKP